MVTLRAPMTVTLSADGGRSWPVGRHLERDFTAPAPNPRWVADITWWTGSTTAGCTAPAATFRPPNSSPTVRSPPSRTSRRQNRASTERGAVHVRNYAEAITLDTLLTWLP
jgi:hypothetical protein